MKPHKKTVVVFNKYGARILVNPGDAYDNVKDSIINPDLTEVKGLPPHYWKLVDGKVVPKTEKEKADMDALHKQNPFNSLKMQVLKKSPSKLYAVAYIALGAAIIELIRLAIMNLP